jgi:hypothetical protein
MSVLPSAKRQPDFLPGSGRPAKDIPATAGLLKPFHQSPFAWTAR